MKISIISDGNFSVNYNRRQNLPPIQFKPHRLISLTVNCYLLQIYGNNILIDTGIGDSNYYDLNKYSVEKPRKLITALKEMSILPDKIDFVINTHLHFDHSNGNFNAEGNCIFENAKFLIQKLEWDSMLKSNEKIRTEAFDRLKEENKIEILDGSTELLKNVNLILAPGHTAGFQYVVVGADNAEDHIFAGDIIPTVWHLNNDNYEDIDFDKVKLHNEKTKILEKCVLNDSKLYYQHSASVKFSKIIRSNNRFRTLRN